MLTRHIIGAAGSGVIEDIYYIATYTLGYSFGWGSITVHSDGKMYLAGSITSSTNTNVNTFIECNVLNGAGIRAKKAYISGYTSRNNVIAVIEAADGNKWAIGKCGTTTSNNQAMALKLDSNLDPVTNGSTKLLAADQSVDQKYVIAACPISSSQLLVAIYDTEGTYAGPGAFVTNSTSRKRIYETYGTTNRLPLNVATMGSFAFFAFSYSNVVYMATENTSLNDANGKQINSLTLTRDYTNCCSINNLPFLAVTGTSNYTGLHIFSLTSTLTINWVKVYDGFNGGVISIQGSAVDNSLLVYTTDNKLLKVSATDGSVIWTREFTSGTSTQTQTYAANCTYRLAVGDDYFIAALNGGAVTSVVKLPLDGTLTGTHGTTHVFTYASATSPTAYTSTATVAANTFTDAGVGSISSSTATVAARTLNVTSVEI